MFLSGVSLVAPSPSKSPDEDVNAYATKMVATLEEKEPTENSNTGHPVPGEGTTAGNDSQKPTLKRPHSQTCTSESENKQATPSRTGCVSSGFPQLSHVANNPVQVTDYSDLLYMA